MHGVHARACHTHLERRAPSAALAWRSRAADGSRWRRAPPRHTRAHSAAAAHANARATRTCHTRERQGKGHTRERRGQGPMGRAIRVRRGGKGRWEGARSRTPSGTAASRRHSTCRGTTSATSAFHHTAPPLPEAVAPPPPPPPKSAGGVRASSTSAIGAPSPSTMRAALLSRTARPAGQSAPKADVSSAPPTCRPHAPSAGNQHAISTQSARNPHAISTQSTRNQSTRNQRHVTPQSVCNQRAIS